MSSRLPALGAMPPRLAAVPPDYAGLCNSKSSKLFLVCIALGHRVYNSSREATSTVGNDAFLFNESSIFIYLFILAKNHFIRVLKKNNRTGEL